MAELPGGGNGDGRHDDLDAWLSAPVRPLPPPPGAFEQVRRRARRRKLRQVTWSAAGTALLVAVGVTVPRLVVPHLGHGRPIAASRPDHDSTPHPAPTSTGLPSGMANSSVPAPTGTPTPSLPPVPANFGVSSVTFVGLGTGWVIGQAGTPGHCGGPNAFVCTSLARTDDGGRTWYGVPAPVTGAPDGPSGVSQVRFLDTANGWAFGPELWATHDGGQHWAQVPTHGLRVTALEASNGRVFAVWARCTGTGPSGAAAGCTGFSVYTATALSDHWARLPGTAGVSAGCTACSASLVLTGGTAYLFAPDGEVLSVAGAGNGTLTPATTGGSPVLAPCRPGPPQPSGLPSQALLASAGPGLALLCPGTAAGGHQSKVLYYSADGGLSWRNLGRAPLAGIASSLAGTPTGRLALATSQGIEVSTSAPAHAHVSWQPASGASAPGGFSYVGMTSDSQGVAVPVQPGQHAVWFTYDGGLHWQPSQVR
jgi:photosystem II stability/assembly factor-like uncharacterized protein